MAVSTMCSFDLKGNKLSFANWISNLSPTETPFVSMTGKETISQTKFQWQTDIIPIVNVGNAQQEGSIPTEPVHLGTKVHSNVTQIFRRGASVSDTANVVAFYGKGKEVGYQMEKAGLEIKRDMEKAFLWQDGGKADNAHGTPAAANTAAHTAGFLGLVAKKDVADTDTQAVVHKNVTADDVIKETELFDLTYNLYLANSKANIIMFHPKHAAFFSSLVLNPTIGASSIGEASNRMKMFKNMDDKFNAEIDTIVDPLGQRFALVPNRQMPTDYLYFFNPSDWTQMVLRAPKKIQLDKKGSFEEWMIEAEIGLRHRNPYASGILKTKVA